MTALEQFRRICDGTDPWPSTLAGVRIKRLAAQALAKKAAKDGALIDAKHHVDRLWALAFDRWDGGTEQAKAKIRQCYGVQEGP